MGILYYKYEFSYNDSCGDLKKETIYHAKDTSTDLNGFYNKEGNVIKTTGTTSYICNIGIILSGCITNSIEITTISKKDFDSIFKSKI